MPEIVKGDGTRELFNLLKLTDSLVRAGIDKELSQRVSESIAGTVHDGMSTTEIFRTAHKMLRKEERVLAARYSMRRAILDLGPTGFPFEDYVSELMRAQGYAVKTRQVLEGKCVPHEVDVVLEKDGNRFGAELKFHNQPGYKTDVKIALYVKARFDDIAANTKGKQLNGGWLVTNTKFTEHAITYSSCAGLTLLGWDYPEKGNLADMIRSTGVYPITVLTTLTAAEKNRLLAEQKPLCSTVLTNPHSLERAGVPPRRIANVVAESTALCTPHTS